MNIDASLHTLKNTYGSLGFGTSVVAQELLQQRATNVKLVCNLDSERKIIILNSSAFDSKEIQTLFDQYSSWLRWLPTVESKRTVDGNLQLQLRLIPKDALIKQLSKIAKQKIVFDKRLQAIHEFEAVLAEVKNLAGNRIHKQSAASDIFS